METPTPELMYHADRRCIDLLVIPNIGAIDRGSVALRRRFAIPFDRFI